MIKNIVKNKKADYNYHIIETYEAGIVLNGAEVKSVREGKVSISDAYAVVEDGELFLYNMHISQYKKSSLSGDPKRRRKLLMHKNQIRRIARKIKNKGLTLIPLRVYRKEGLIKVEIALVKGKKKYEKRDKLLKKAQKKEIERNL